MCSNFVNLFTNYIDEDAKIFFYHLAKGFPFGISINGIKEFVRTYVPIVQYSTV